MYADDPVLIGYSRDNLEELLKEFDTVFRKINLKVNAGKNKVMVCANTERREQLNLSLNWDILEEVDTFKNLASIIGKNGSVFEDVLGRVNMGLKVSGATTRLWKVRSVCEKK